MKHLASNGKKARERGRFISEDPIGLKGGINMYTFGNNDPINTADPSGKLWVYIWNTDLAGGSGGHASIRLENGTYISWWPGVSNFWKGVSWTLPSFVNGLLPGDVRAVPDRTFDQDRSDEKRNPDFQIHMTFLDENAIGRWWNGFQGTSNYNLLSQNCAETVADALRAGGASIGGLSGILCVRQ